MGSTNIRYLQQIETSFILVSFVHRQKSTSNNLPAWREEREERDGESIPLPYQPYRILYQWRQTISDIPHTHGQGELVY